MNEGVGELRNARGAGPSSRTRYTVVGFVGGGFGLSVAALNTLQVLTASGRAVEVVPVELGRHRATPRARDALEGARRLTLFHMNPLDIAATAGGWRRAVSPDAARVCVPFWEMPLPPRAWVPMLDAMDAVLAPTRFIEAACATAIAPERIVHYPQAVFVPPGIATSRARWGLSQEALVFVVTFDLGSDIERKNPWAAIDAFQRAFPGARDVQLVLKMRPWPGIRDVEDQAHALRRRAAGDPRIVIVEERLSYEDVLSLYASCDVMVSLHRSEGLGLHLMEAMSLGKVVVATGWSGNVDFMDGENSVLVPYRLVAVAPRHPSYLAEIGRPGQVWADPDVNQAAAELAALRRDPVRRRALGEAAARAMASRRAAVVAGGAFDALEGRLAALPERGKAFGGAVLRTRVLRFGLVARSVSDRLRRSIHRLTSG